MHFTVLGPVRAQHDDGTEMPLAGAKKKTMLAALLMARGRVVTDTTLSDMLWGTRSPDTYQAQIYTYASRLRIRLSDGAHIARHGSGYRLTMADGWVDHAEFERLSVAGSDALRGGRHEEAHRLLHDALALWQGTALTGVTEPFAQRERPGMEEMHLATLEDRIDADLVVDDCARLLPELLALVRAHPLRERLRSQYMIALHRSNQQAAAFDTYHEAVSLLRAELGVMPGALLRSAHQTVLEDRPGPVRPRVPESPDGPVVLRTRPEVGPGIPDFVGRRNESAAVGELVTARAGATHRQQPVVVVTGMPGVGKTTFAIEAANLARDRFPDGQVLVPLRSGRGDQPLIEALDTLLAAIGTRPDDGTAPDDVTSRLELYHRSMGDRRMLVVLDDVADAAHARALLPRSPRSRLMVTTSRLLGALDGQHTIALEPLGSDDSRELLTGIVGAERVDAERAAVDRVVELCEGLPLALRAAGARAVARPNQPLSTLARQLGDRVRALDALRAGDIDVRARLLDRYHALGEDDRRVLRGLADCQAAEFPPSLTGELLDIDGRRGERITEDLVDGHLLREAGTDRSGRPLYRFHRLVRLAVRDEAVPVTRSA